MTDLTIIYYTCGAIPIDFSQRVWDNLSDVAGDIPIVKIEQPLSTPRSHLQIYRNALEGAKQATTKYIGIAEDDVLYSADHFNHRPEPGVFLYDKNVWTIYTWVKPAIFSYKDRRNMYSLICERDLFIEAMEERFAKIKDENISEEWLGGHWAEPGRYEQHLGVTKRNSATFYAKEPSVAFSHETALSFAGLGKRKRLGDLKALEIPLWGRADDIIQYYV